MLENIDYTLLPKMLNQVSDPIFILSPDFKFMWANDAYSRYMKMDLDGIISRSLDRVIPPEYSSVLKNKFMKISQKKPAFENIYPSALPDGSIIIEKWHNEGVYNDDGKLNYYYCIGSLKEKEEGCEDSMSKTDLVSSTLIRSSLLGIIVAIEGEISYINQKTWELLGLKVGEVTENMKLADFFKKFLPDYNCRISENNSSTSTLNDEVFFIHPDGQKCWISIIRKQQILNKTSTNLILIEDITNRKNNEIEIENTKNKMTEVMRITKVGYWEKDFTNDCWLWSDEIYNIFEIKKGTRISEKLLAGYFKKESMDIRKQYLSEIEKTDSTSFSYKIEYKISPPESSDKWISGESFFKKDVNGRYKSHFGWIQDITARKKIEEALIAAKEKAEQSERLKTAFLANMSHEIRTPLNAILGFTDLLTRDITPDEKVKFNQIIKQSSDLLLNIIGDILDISRIESGTLELNIENISIKEMFETISTIFSDQPTDRIRLRFEEVKEDISVVADRERLKQVFINLISNAYKYTESGYIHISCSFNEKNKRAVFSVKDTGCGIAPDMQKRIFERFYQTDSFNKGTGLGLAITRSLIEQMDGLIWVKSKLNEGSEFIFSLPSA